MFIFEKGKFRKTQSNEEAAVYRVLQEIQLFLGENPYRSELGIDYLGVFANQVFFRDKLQVIIDKYASLFKSLEIVDYNTEGEYLTVIVQFMFDNAAVTKKISIGGN